ncbi:hypothetical protein [Thermocatellispora tengchongensis]|uniref:hypothetical protein n=1 Tax=Thermocatellispora tengchongensis TaxID=1073253 RepID=UPI00363E1B07
MLEGVFRAGLDTALAYRFIRDTVWVAAGWYRAGGRLGAAEIARQYVAMVLEGILADRGKPAGADRRRRARWRRRTSWRRCAPRWAGAAAGSPACTPPTWARTR